MPQVSVCGGSCWVVGDPPPPNASTKAATGEQAPIRTPAACKHRSSMREWLELPATQWVPEPHRRVIAPTGEHASIRSKGQPVGALGVPAQPERGPTGDVPQRDAAIKARAGERAFVRAEGKGNHIGGVRLRLPDEM